MDQVMKRVAVDVSNFRAPFDSVPFAGLGQVSWPPGRSYWNTSDFRAPYDKSALVNASLLGLGAPPVVPAADLLPDRFRRYVLTGEPMTNVVGTAQSATNQVPRWAWALLALGASTLAYRAWKEHKRAHPTMTG